MLQFFFEAELKIVRFKGVAPNPEDAFFKYFQDQGGAGNGSVVICVARVLVAF